MNHRQKRLLIDRQILMLFVIVCINCGSCPAQDIKSPYNLRKIRIGLMDGRVISGTLMAITPDSLAIQNALATPPGTIAYFRFRASNKTATCEVKEVTETGLILSAVGNPETFRCAFNDVNVLQIKKCPLDGKALLDFQRQWFPAHAVKYITMHRKGSGGIGALAGLGAGAVIGFAIGSASNEPQSPQPAKGYFQFNIEPVPKGTGEAVLLGLVGLTTGAVIGSSNKKTVINGDAERFRQVWKMMVR